MRIMTWNVNSVRLRLPLLLEVLARYEPDVVCLQETKTVDADFPLAPLAAAGYPHAAVSGMKAYNGVAILARAPLTQVRAHARVGRDDRRHLSAVVDGVEVHSLYVPAGGDVPNRDVNEKFSHKLDFLAELSAWWPAELDPARPAVVAGDFNIAPLPADVWSHAQLRGVVSHTEIEIAALEAMRAGFGWVDAVRAVVPAERSLYSWWSYRAKDWTKGDRGRRLDHVWVSPALKDAVHGAVVLRDLRGARSPSDHVPVLVDLAHS